MEHCKFWEIICGLIGVVIGAGGTLLVIKIRIKRGNTSTRSVVQRDISTGGGDVAGGDIKKTKE
jgi:hypothetical protein